MARGALRVNPERRVTARHISSTDISSSTASTRRRQRRAKRKATRSILRNCTSASIWIDFLEHDTAGMEQEGASLMRKPGQEDQMLNFEADTALYGGQLSKARALTLPALQKTKGHAPS